MNQEINKDIYLNAIAVKNVHFMVKIADQWSAKFTKIRDYLNRISRVFVNQCSVSIAH